MNTPAELKVTKLTLPSGRVKLTKTLSPDQHAFLFEGKRTLHTFNRDYHSGRMNENKILYPTHELALQHLRALGHDGLMRKFCNYCKSLNKTNTNTITAHI